MKFNNENNALFLLADASPVLMLGANQEQQAIKNLQYFKDHFAGRRNLYRGKIQYISEPFFKAYMAARDKFDRFPGGITLEQHGTFVRPLSNGYTNTVFYDIKAVYTNKAWEFSGNLAYVCSMKNSPFPIVTFCTDVGTNHKHTYMETTTGDLNGFEKSFVSDFLAMLLFVKLCPVETKIINAGSKTKIDKEKYFNNTQSPIEILDSTWFTTIVRTAGIMVGEKEGGFLRWQRCGPGLSRIEPRWIFPFERVGFVRQAGVLKER